MELAFQLDNLDSMLKRARDIVTLLRKAEDGNKAAEHWLGSFGYLRSELEDAARLVAEIERHPDVLRAAQQGTPPGKAS